MIRERVESRQIALKAARRMAELASNGLNNLQNVTDTSEMVRLMDTAWKMGKPQEEVATTVHIHLRNIREKPKLPTLEQPLELPEGKQPPPEEGQV